MYNILSMNLTFTKKIVFVLVIVGLLLTLWGINYPFVGIYNANNNYLSLAAKNYLRFGFANLKFFPTYFAGDTLPLHVPYYLHHPILIFPLSAIPYMIFGFKNWVVHATNFLFLMADVFLLYKIASIVWNKKVGLWAAGLAVVFPMTTFFWKYIFFEQSSLFFNLCVFLAFLSYIKKQTLRSLAAIFVFTFLSGLVDWGVLYLFFPFVALFFTPYKKFVTKPLIVYLFATGLSLSIFIISVFLLQGGFGELGNAISTRSYTAELTGLSLWPIRLAIISLVRTLLYFTPVVVLWIWDGARSWKKKETFDLPKMTLLFFTIFGSLNLFFLPTATWGHSYFLFYFIPLFCFLGATWFVKREKNVWKTLIWVFVIVVASVTVNYLKLEQVKKQLWKYDVAVDIHKSLRPYEQINVVNFPGDLMENYFFHPTIAMKLSDLPLLEKKTRGLVGFRVIVACEGTCTPEELGMIDMLKKRVSVIAYHASGNTAWLITQDGSISPTREAEEHVSPTIKPQIQEGNIFLRLYRQMRDLLNVGQI